MLAFILEELREWCGRRLRRILSASALLLAAVGALSSLQPLLMALAATLLFTLAGWADGNRYLSSPESRRILIDFPVPPRTAAAAKALSSLATWGFTALLLSPPLALSAAAWGLEPGALAACCLAWFACYYAALCVGFLSSLVFSGTEGLPGLLLLVLWLALPLFLRPLAPSNPFMQVWDVLKEEGGAAPFAGMGATLAAATALLAAAALRLSRMRRRQNA